MDDAPSPRGNAELVGHDQAERTLFDAYLSGRLHHAWLITGPRGIGKATLSFRFARFLFAHGNGAGAPCSDVAGPGLFGDDAPLQVEPHPGSRTPSASSLHVDPAHPVFARVASGGHADLVSVERRINEKTGRLRSEIVVEDVRSVAARLAHTPAEGGWRIAVVDAAEDMNRSAANALLKVLEEPPARAILLLVSHAPGRLLPTIRSRCRKLAMGPLPAETVRALLGRYRPGLAMEDGAALARLSGGSIGLALSLADEDGLTVYGALTGLMASLPGLDVVALNRLGDQVGKAGAEQSFAMATEFFRWWLGQLIRFKAVSGPGSSGSAGPGEGGGGGEGIAFGAAAGDAERAIVARLAPAAGLDRWLEVWEKTSGLLARAESANLDRKQVVLNLFLTLARAVRS